MNIAALLTSAGINIGICVVLFSLYSILRKQPGNVIVYFGRRIASRSDKNNDIWLHRFVPSPSWIVKAWETSDEEIIATGGFDAQVFMRIIVFSIRLFSIAAVICTFSVLPVNYYGQERLHKQIPLESLEVFTIENVKEGSKWLWTHCLALYIITFSACILLYFEYKSITKMMLEHIVASPPNPRDFAILVRSIPWTSEESYCDTVKKFFSNYHASNYLSHVMVYKSSTIRKLMRDAEKMCKIVMHKSPDEKSSPGPVQCGFCKGPKKSCNILQHEESVTGHAGFVDMHFPTEKRECGAAFVFFKSRYAASVAVKVLQTTNPMSWVTDLAPEPHDAHWSNLCIPYRQFWIRKLAIRLASTAFMLVFLIPVTFVQGLTQLEQLQKYFPFLKGILHKTFVSQLVTGYMPSVILVLFMCAVPPMMMLFSTVEGHISRSLRKRSTCCKVLFFTIWNVFFVNVFTGSVIRQVNVISSLKDIPSELAKAVPSQATFFITYVLSSGWASLACEVMQIFPLLCNLFSRCILGRNDCPSDSLYSFPYHTEVPRVLLFGFLGLSCAILAPLILPFLVVYFFFAYLVYKNQIMNVYVAKYETRGQYWPIVHNTTIFSLVFSQIIALGVFGIKRSSVASGFTVPLIIITLMFHDYCRQRFLPLFRNQPVQVLIELDRRDEQLGRMEDIYKHLYSSYGEFMLKSNESSKCSSSKSPVEEICVQELEKIDTVEPPSEADGSGSWTVVNMEKSEHSSE